jgi:hypothetical protein
MMRRHPTLLLLVVAVVLTWLVRPYPTPPAVRPAPPAVAEPVDGQAAPKAALQYQGTASCAAAACHHGNGPPGSKGSEYTTWALQDPHARAYAVLSDERSRRMLASLKRLPDAGAARPQAEGLCLNCHVLPALEQTRRRDRFSVNDGVGCETCHGPAEQWLHTHYLKSWPGTGPGFRDTKDLRVRAELCVGCHVGQGDRDVNHDLIAAGHPPLRFDFSAYLAVYPRHWPAAADTHRQPDFEVRAWLLGRLVAAEAALNLLAHRADNAVAQRGPWPEFAEYECAACHHALRDDSDRQRRGAAGRLGSPSWGTWYFALLPALSRQTPGGSGPVRTALEEVEKVMGARSPDAKAVQRQAEFAAQQVQRWRAGLDKVGPLKEPQVRALLVNLVANDPPLFTNWEEATQLYLGLSALHQGMADLSREHRNRPEMRKALHALDELLSGAFPNGGDSRYDSPSSFKADAVAAELAELRKGLR